MPLNNTLTHNEITRRSRSKPIKITIFDKILSQDDDNDWERIASDWAAILFLSLYRPNCHRGAAAAIDIDVVVIYDEKNENAATYEIDQNFMVYPNPYHKPSPLLHNRWALHESVFR